MSALDELIRSYEPTPKGQWYIPTCPVHGRHLPPTCPSCEHAPAHEKAAVWMIREFVRGASYADCIDTPAGHYHLERYGLDNSRGVRHNPRQAARLRRQP